MFFKKWTYVNTVSISDGVATFAFNRDSETPGPFALEVVILDPISGAVRSTFTDVSWTSRDPLHLRLPPMDIDETFMLQMTLDGRLAYQNTFRIRDSAVIPPR